MTARTKAVAIPETEAVEALLREVSEAQAPMIQRLGSHRDKLDLARKELEGERYEILSRRDLLRRQMEAVEQGMQAHLDDIDACLALYDGGLNSLTPQS